MTLLSPTIGQRVIRPVKLTTTANTTIAAGKAKLPMTLDSIRFSARAGGSTISLFVSDGTTDYYLLENYSLAANTAFQIEGHHVVLLDGWSLKAKAGTANIIDVMAVLIQSSATGSAQ